MLSLFQCTDLENEFWLFHLIFDLLSQIFLKFRFLKEAEMIFFEIISTKRGNPLLFPPYILFVEIFFIQSVLTLFFRDWI